MITSDQVECILRSDRNAIWERCEQNRRDREGAYKACLFLSGAALSACGIAVYAQDLWIIAQAVALTIVAILAAVVSVTASKKSIRLGAAYNEASEREKAFLRGERIVVTLTGMGATEEYSVVKSEAP